ncbi:uncharacterized protein [Amphiura filiformis]|uniref:uncharacterized protein n=1 Tax=Amphiura filiformis TaxID=82378 RepID=UPI003B21B2F4
MIEDFDRFGDPLSRISLSFLLNVSSDNSKCEAPKIISPEKGCKAIVTNQPFELNVLAKAASGAQPIERIESTKPRGMTDTSLSDVDGYPLHKSMTLTWTPESDQLGIHSVGISAVDIDGYASVWSFITLNVANELYPLPESSNPSRDQTKNRTKNWTIMFNKSIRRPTESAYITLTDQSGDVVSRTDSSDSRQVTFHDDFIEFDALLNVQFPGTQAFQLHVAEGVAIDGEPGNCVLSSQASEWTVNIESEEPQYTKAPDTKPNPNLEHYKCADGYADIVLPQDVKAGRQCFVRPLVRRFTITSRGDTTSSVNVPYEVCCETTCTQYL